MIPLLYFLVGILLMIVQTSILPRLPFLNYMYDLLIPIVIHASIFGSMGEGLGIALLFGMLMDNISGAPAGFFLTFYVWIFFVVRYLKILLHVDDIALVTLVIVVGVALEGAALIGLVAVNSVMVLGVASMVGLVLTEVFWAALTAPLLLFALNFLLKQLPALPQALFSSRHDEIKGR